MSSPGQILTAELYLDILSNTFNGLYLLLEAVTIIDAMQIDSFSIWGTEYEAVLRIESQRCWFFTLLFSAVASVVCLSRNLPELKAAQLSRLNSSPGDKNTAVEERKKREKAKGSEKAAWAHLRKLIASVLDLLLPGSFLGWIHAEPLTVGLAMMITSILTGFEVWERCGKNVVVL